MSSELYCQRDVREFWQKASCGETLYLDGPKRADYAKQSQRRYALETYIRDFARFDSVNEKHVLEIGVGLGADHEEFALAGALLTGIDLSQRAVEHVRRRLEFAGLRSSVDLGDAENLAFADNSFDLVYAYGVLHHCPAPQLAIAEIYRVLKPSAEAKIMLYHCQSLVAYMLWFRYAFLTWSWHRTIAEIVATKLESPGTKAFTIPEAQQLFSDFCGVNIKSELTPHDLLLSPAGQRHAGLALKVARLVWPRWLISRYFAAHGLALMITAYKPPNPG